LGRWLELDPSGYFSVNTGGAHHFAYGFQGATLYATIRFYRFRKSAMRRTSIPQLIIEPIRANVSDGNLFRFVRNNPVNALDPSGNATLHGVYGCCSLPIPKEIGRASCREGV